MKKLHLSTKDLKILGVCGGLSESLGVSSDIIRLVFLVSIFFGGTGLIAYMILYFVLPKEAVEENIIDVKVDIEGEQDAGKGKPFRRSIENRFFGGVCGGLSEYIGIDVSIISLLFVVLSFVGGVGLIAYIVMWFVIPDSQ